MDLTPSVVYDEKCFLLDEYGIVEHDLNNSDNPIRYQSQVISSETGDTVWVPFSLMTGRRLVMRYTQSSISKIHRVLVNLSFEKEIL